jgi:hypothetical protein
MWARLPEAIGVALICLVAFFTRAQLALGADYDISPDHGAKCGPTFLSEYVNVIDLTEYVYCLCPTFDGVEFVWREMSWTRDVGVTLATWPQNGNSFWSRLNHKFFCQWVVSQFDSGFYSEFICRGLSGIFIFKLKFWQEGFKVLDYHIGNADIRPQLPFGVSFSSKPQQESGHEQCKGERRNYYGAQSNDRVLSSLGPGNNVIPLLFYVFLYVGPALGLVLSFVTRRLWTGGTLVTIWLLLVLCLLFSFGKDGNGRADEESENGQCRHQLHSKTALLNILQFDDLRADCNQGGNEKRGREGATAELACDRGFGFV